MALIPKNPQNPRKSAADNTYNPGIEIPPDVDTSVPPGLIELLDSVDQPQPSTSPSESTQPSRLPTEDRGRSQDRAEFLEVVRRIVTEDRNIQYGEPEDFFEVVADLWSIYLGLPLMGKDVTALQILYKVARVRVNPGHLGSWLDISGYGSIGGTLPATDDDSE